MSLATLEVAQLFKDGIILIFGIDLLMNPSVNNFFAGSFHSSVSFLTFFLKYECRFVRACR